MEEWNGLNSRVDMFRNISFCDHPPIVNNHLLFLLIYDEHNALLGATNMRDILWNGTIWHYNDIADISRKNATAMRQMDKGICDAGYLTEDKFVVVGDYGDVEIFQLVQNSLEGDSEQFLEFQSLNCTHQHDDGILSVSVFPNRRNIVTGGLDCCIKVWDVENLIATHSFHSAHTDVVTDTAVSPMSDFIFASTSFSGDVLIWDIRQVKPAYSAYNWNYSLSTVTWKTASEHIIAIGTDEGSIALIDIRASDPILESTENDRDVHKMLFNPNPERKEQLACCFSDTVVKVLDTDKDMLTVFEDSTHTDFVRALAWHNNNLFSAAWDGNVIKHEVPSSTNPSVDN